MVRFGVAPRSNSALLTDAFSSLRCACGAANRGRSVARWQHRQYQCPEGP